MGRHAASRVISGHPSRRRSAWFLPGDRFFLMASGNSRGIKDSLLRLSEFLQSQPMSQLATENATRGHVGDDVATLAADAEALCRRVAGHDLAGAPIYIVCQSTLASEFGRAEGCDGYTTPSLDLYLADHIAGYRGRGPCFVVNDIMLREDQPDDFAYWFSAIVLHELAHVLERRALFDDRAGEDPMKLKFEAICLSKIAAEPEAVAGPPYRGHEAPFIRTVLHLRHRAAMAHTRIAPSALFNSRHLGLSRPERYAAALADEPARCAGMSFRDILATKPPRKFSQIWNQDVFDWLERSLKPQGACV
jgi:hypothetical protein